MLDYSNVRMDFIIRSWARDNNKSIVEPEMNKGEHPTQILVEWSNKLLGKAQKEFDKNPVLFFSKRNLLSKEQMNRLFNNKRND